MHIFKGVSASPFGVVVCCKHFGAESLFIFGSASLRHRLLSISRPILLLVKCMKRARPEVPAPGKKDCGAEELTGGGG